MSIVFKFDGKNGRVSTRAGKRGEGERVVTLRVGGKVYRGEESGNIGDVLPQLIQQAAGADRASELRSAIATGEVHWR